MFDIVVVVFVGLLTLVGLWKGFVRQIVGFGGVLVGFAVAMKYSGPLAARFLTGFRPVTGHVITFIALFVICMALATIVSWAIGKALNIVGLGIVNRLAGGLLGAAKGYLIVAVATLVVIAYLPMANELLRGSHTSPYITPMADAVSTFAPKSMREKYEERTGKSPHLPHKESGNPDKKQDRSPTKKKSDTQLFI